MSGFSENAAGERQSISRGSQVPVSVLLLLCPILPALQGCHESVGPTESQLGGIEVTTLTESPTSLPDSFTVLLNGAEAGRVGPNDVYVIPYLPPGNYLVELKDEWEGCWLGVNPRPVTVEPKHDLPITYLVRCSGEPSLKRGCI